MKIIACYKIVPDEQSIKINGDRTLDTSAAEKVIGQYDLNAVEAGARLVESHGGELIALTVGGAEVENSKLRKGILSRGPSSCVVVRDDGIAGADSSRISAALAKAVAETGEYDLVLCGEGSSDLYARQVGVQLGERLGVPTVNGVVGIEYADDGFVTVSRDADGELETLRIKLPAVISVSSGINTLRIPGMKDILAAGKKPFAVRTAQELELSDAAPSTTVSVLAPEQHERACRIFKGDDADTVAAFAGAISAELK